MTFYSLFPEDMDAEKARFRIDKVAKMHWAGLTQDTTTPEQLACIRTIVPPDSIRFVSSIDVAMLEAAAGDFIGFESFFTLPGSPEERLKTLEVILSQGIYIYIYDLVVRLSPHECYTTYTVMNIFKTMMPHLRKSIYRSGYAKVCRRHLETGSYKVADSDKSNVIMLRRKGLTFDQIARQIGISASSVYRIYKANVLSKNSVKAGKCEKRKI